MLFAKGKLNREIIRVLVIDMNKWREILNCLIVKVIIERNGEKKYGSEKNIRNNRRATKTLQLYWKSIHKRLSYFWYYIIMLT